MPNSPGSEGQSSPTKSSSTSLATYREAHSRADAFCRDVQGFVEEVGIPAINEMRYAGHHLILSLNDDGAVVKPEELARAINHANRACYEAGEAGIMCALDIISKFKQDYSTIPVSGTVPNFVQILVDADDALARVTSERDHGDDRIVDHADFEQKFRTLKAHCRVLDGARDELNKALIRQKNETRRFVITTVLAVLAIVVTVAIGLPPLLKNEPAPIRNIQSEAELKVIPQATKK